MAITFTSTQPGANSDYTKYLYDKTQKTDRYNDSDLCDFTLVPFDAAFVKLTRGAYVTIDSTKYPKWFTGYITNDPELQFLGANSSNQPVYGYKYQATSDDYLLSLNSVGILTPFMNVNMGQIIKFFAARFAPGLFDVSNVGNGTYIADYVIDPTKRFSDLVKDFCQAASYQFYCKDHKLYFVQQDSASVGFAIDGNDKHFTPAMLTLQPSQTPLINDVTVLGGKEPQTYFNEYFVGSGLDAQFPLSADVFGVDRYILLDEDFSASSIDSNKWNVNDTGANYLQLSNGYLNVIGGPGDGLYGVNLQSIYSIPIDGNVRLTHGEWDFLQPSATSVTHGVICSLWTDQPAASFANCLYGLSVYHDAGGLLKLSPIVNGTADLSQSVTVSSSRRYVIRTVLSCRRMNRLSNVYTFTDQNGAVGTYGGGGIADIATWQTFLTEIDTTNGSTTNQFVMVNSGASLTINNAYAIYVPVVTDTLHATVSGITVSIPIQVALEHQAVAGVGNFVKKLVGPNELDASDRLAPVATVVQGNTNAPTKASYTGTPQYNPGAAVLTYFKDSTKQTATTPQVGELIHVSYRSSGAAAARLQSQDSISSEAAAWGDNGVRAIVRNGDVKPRPRSSAECELAAAAILSDNSYQHYEGKYKIFSDYCTSEPLAGRILKFQNLPSNMPSYLKAEEVTEVVTVLLNSTPTELFEHELSFGKTDHLRQAVGKFNEPIGLFEPDDQSSQTAVVTPAAGAIGTAFAPDVVAPTLQSWTSTQYTLSTNQAPVSLGGFEVRYTDDSWGCDDGKNLITRTIAGSGTTVFDVPRNYRSRSFFISAYDARNNLLYSEDQSQSAWLTDSTVSLTLTNNPDYRRTSIYQVVMAASAGHYIKQATNVLCAVGLKSAFTVSLSGTGQVQLLLSNGASDTALSPVINLTSGWQRITVPKTFTVASGLVTASIVNVGSGAATFRMTRASVETNTLVETAYAKTKSTKYGANSRFPSAVHISLPLVPPAPTATIAYSDFVSPTVNVTLPVSLQDVWGVEIRGYDNTTVLYHQDLVSASYTPSFTDPANVPNPYNATTNPYGPTMEYYVYTYNLLGEYCAVPVHLNSNSSRPSAPFPWKANAVSYVPVNNTVKSYTYGLDITYSTDASGGAGIQLGVSGFPPWNSQMGTAGPPTVPAAATTSSTGGTVVPGSYVIMICSVDSSNTVSVVSTATTVIVPAGTSTNTIVVSGIVWPASAVSYLVFMGPSVFNLARAASVTGTGTPSSLTITAPPGSYGPPDELFDHFRIKTKFAFHLGVGAFPVSVLSGSTVSCAGAAWTTNQFAGRRLSVLARGALNSLTDVSPAVLTIVSNTASVLTISVSDVSSPAAPLSTFVSPGDVVVIRTLADTFTSTTIGDSQVANTTPGSSSTGFAVNGEVGRLLRIIAGTGTGSAPVQIISNTSTVLTIGGSFPVTPDSTSVFVIEAATWDTDLTTHTFLSKSILPSFGPLSVPSIGSYDISNFSGRQVIIAVITETVGKKSVPEYLAPIRDFYVVGSQGTRTVTTNTTATLTDRSIRVDTSAGNVTITLPAYSTMLNQVLVVVKVTSDANTVTITGGASGSIVLATQWAQAQFRSNS